MNIIEYCDEMLKKSKEIAPYTSGVAEFEFLTKDVPKLIDILRRFSVTILQINEDLSKRE